MKPTYTFLPDLTQQIDAIPAHGIVSRTLYKGDGARAVLFGFAEGEELTEHTSARQAVLHFLRGEARLTLGNDAFEVGPGAWAHLPPLLPHSIQAKTEVLMLLLLLDG